MPRDPNLVDLLENVFHLYMHGCNAACRVGSQQFLSYIARYLFPFLLQSCCDTSIAIQGSKSDPENYHHISLTSVVCKFMENIIVSQIMKHLEKYNILIDS